MSFSKDLRASVLQAAMQGKLTEQLETDTPVSELLSKMNINPKYNDDEIAPDSWQWVEMQDIVKLEKGEKTENKKLPYLEARYLRTSNEAKMYTSGEFVAKGMHVILVDGENSGEVFLVPEDGYMGSTFKVLSINKEMDKDFILKILLFYKDMFRQSKKGSAIPHLNKKIFKELMVAIPPIEEQKRIVQRIEEIMRHIDELEAIEEELKKLKEAFPDDMKAAVLQAAMQGKLTEQLDTDSSVDELLENIAEERENLIKEGKIKKSKKIDSSPINDVPFDIPENWTWTTLQSACLLMFMGKSPMYTNVKNNNICIGQKNNQESGIDFRDEKYVTNEFIHSMPHYMYLQNFDVLLNTLGTGTVGRSGIWTGEKNCVITDGHLLVCRTNNVTLARYILYVLKLKQKEIESSADGSTNQKFLKLNDVGNYVIPFPPIEEQQRIVDKLETILPLIKDV